MLAGKGGDLAPVSANCHRTPAAAVRPRFVVEKEPAMGIGAQPEPCPCTLGDEFCRRTGNGSKQPIEAAFARDEFDSPDAILVNQFVVPFGDAKYLVDRRDRFHGYLLLPMHGRERLAKRGAEPPRFEEQSFRCLGIGLRQSEKLSAAFRRDDADDFQEKNESVPRQFGVGRRCVDEVEAEPPAKQLDT